VVVPGENDTDIRRRRVAEAQLPIPARDISLFEMSYGQVTKSRCVAVWSLLFEILLAIISVCE